MDFSRTQLSGLLNSITHEKTKYINILHKLRTILSLQRDHKLILNSTDKLILTSSPQVIYENLNVSHPVLKILLEFLGRTRKMGSGDKFFVSLLGALVDHTSTLLDSGIKPKLLSDALKDISVLNVLEEASLASGLEQVNVEEKTKDGFVVNEDVRSYVEDFLGNTHVSSILVECMEATRSFDTEKIRICKVQTGSMEDSYRTSGMVIDRLPEGTVTRHTNTSVGMFNCPLDITRTELKGTVLLRNHEELLNFSTDEIEAAKKLVDSLNTNVLIVSGNVSEVFMDFVDSRSILVLRIFNKYDMKRICDLVGGSIYNTLGPVKEKGFAQEIGIMTDGSRSFTRIVSCTGNVNTIVLKSSVKEALDEMERKIVSVLENLQQRACTRIQFSDSGSIDCAVGVIQNHGRSAGSIAGVVADAVCRGLRSVACTRLVLDDMSRCIRYSLECLATILEIDDYLVAKLDQLDVRPPQTGHWDD